jgi:sec-independent protein translocase protein TatC
VFPTVFGYFAGSTPEGVKWETDITQYLDFAMQMFFGFGLAFEVPVAVVLLVITGIVPIEKLRSNRGYVLVGVFVVAAAVTPPDAISQCSMAIPMYLLYEGGLIMAAVMSNMRKKDAARREAEAP